MIGEDRLSEKAIHTIQKTLKSPREIKNLGHGAEQVADLILHPKHGLAVRKVPLLHTTHPETKASELGAAKTRTEMWKTIRRESGGKGDFAHLIDHSPDSSISYYEYAKPDKKDRGPRLVRLGRLADKREREARRAYMRLDKQVTEAAKKGLDTAAIEARIKRYQDSAENNSKRFMALRKATREDAALNKETETVLGRVRKKYPYLRDARDVNMVGGKLVDLTPDWNVKTLHAGKEYVPKQGPVGHSKKEFLGDGRSRFDASKEEKTSPKKHHWLRRYAGPIGGVVGGSAAGYYALKRKKERDRRKTKAA